MKRRTGGTLAGFTQLLLVYGIGTVPGAGAGKCCSRSPGGLIDTDGSALLPWHQVQESLGRQQYCHTVSCDSQVRHWGQGK